LVPIAELVPKLKPGHICRGNITGCTYPPVHAAG
jgi:hypothetical protein